MNLVSGSFKPELISEFILRLVTSSSGLKSRANSSALPINSACASFNFANKVTNVPVSSFILPCSSLTAEKISALLKPLCSTAVTNLAYSASNSCSRTYWPALPFSSSSTGFFAF